MVPSISEQVYQNLYRDIRKGLLLPGEPVREDVLAREHNVSRTPVREALQRLLHSGLLERSVGGYKVRRLTAEQVSEIYPIIAALEGLGARVAASQIESEELAELDALHREIVAAAKREDRDAVQNVNVKFHSVILNASRNEVLVEEVERFRAITEHFRSIILRLPQRPDQSIKDHEEVIAALKKGDGEAAERIMRAHVTSAHTLLLSVIEAGKYLDLSNQ